MSIEEIKDIKKLQKMLKYEMELRQYTYECCEEAGKEMEKNSFAWDGKEKNLVIQAMELNERYDNLKQTLTEIKPILELYANSKVGEEQLDGTYKITVKNSSILGDTYITFDPRPAKQALQKIKMEGEHSEG